jgi:hypothetical protein
VVSYGVLWQSLGVFLTKNLLMSGKFCWYSMDRFGWNGPWVEQHSSDKILRGFLGSGYILLSGKELGPFCILYLYNDG